MLGNKLLFSIITALVISNLVTGILYYYQKNEATECNGSLTLVTETLKLNKENAETRDKENKASYDALYEATNEYWRAQITERELDTAKERAKLEGRIGSIQSMLDDSNSMLHSYRSFRAATENESDTGGRSEADRDIDLSTTQVSLAECKENLLNTVRAAVDTDIQYERLYNIKANECAVYGCE